MAMVPSIQDRYDLTPQQAAFVEHMMAGATPAESAERAGYSNSETWSYATSGARLLRHPAIVLSLRAEVARRLQSEGSALGFAVLTEIARDTSAPKAVRAGCARDLLNLGGHIAPKAEAAAPGDKMLGEMTADELKHVVNTCEGELAARATPVNPPSAPIIETQHTDIFD